MRTVKLVLLLTLAIAVAAVVLQNQAPLRVQFLWLTGEVPGVILLFMTAVAGFIIGLTAALMVKSGAKPKPWNREKNE